MSDPLDDVIAVFEREAAERSAHQAELRRRANILVNQWPHAMNPIFDEMNKKLARFGLPG